MSLVPPPSSLLSSFLVSSKKQTTNNKVGSLLSSSTTTTPSSSSSPSNNESRRKRKKTPSTTSSSSAQVVEAELSCADTATTKTTTTSLACLPLRPPSFLVRLRGVTPLITDPSRLTSPLPLSSSLPSFNSSHPNRKGNETVASLDESHKTKRIQDTIITQEQVDDDNDDELLILDDDDDDDDDDPQGPDFDCFLEEPPTLPLALENNKDKDGCTSDDGHNRCLFPKPLQPPQQELQQPQRDSCSSIPAFDLHLDDHDDHCLFPDLEALRYWTHQLLLQQDCTNQPSNDDNNNNMPLATSTMGGGGVNDDDFWERSHQGVLWKRRDVFKNRWRPRWFVLQPRQGTLTYYLFSSLDGVVAAEQWEAFTLQQQQQQYSLPESLDAGDAAARNRTVSYDSAAAQVTVFSDLSQQVESVVPRGTLYLPGCRVERNDALSRAGADEQLFAWTIHVPPGALTTTAAGSVISSSSSTAAAAAITTPRSSLVYLAARTAQTRDVWMQHLARVCRQRQPPSPEDNPFRSVHVPDMDNSNTAATASSNNNNNNNNMAAEDDSEATNPFAHPPPPVALGRNQTHPPPAVTASVALANSYHNVLPTQRGIASAPTTPRRFNSLPLPPTAITPVSSSSRHQQSLMTQEMETATASTTSVPLTPTWEPLGSLDDLYENVPRGIRDLIEERIETYMPLLLHDPENEPGWKAIPQQHGRPGADGVQTRTYWRPHHDFNKGTTLVHSVAEFPTLDPTQLFRALVDYQQRPSYDASCSLALRLHQYNPHTLLDVYQYSSSILWPRTMACVVHWRCCARTTPKGSNNGTVSDGGRPSLMGFDEVGGNAILMVAASCPEASQKWQEQPQSKSNQKESVLHVSIMLLRPSHSGGGTFTSRLVALDPQVPGWAQGMAQGFFSNGQAKIPTALSEHIILSQPPQQPLRRRGNVMLHNSLTDEGLLNIVSSFSAGPDDDKNNNISSSTRSTQQTNGKDASIRSPPTGKDRAMDDSREKKAKPATSTEPPSMVQSPSVAWQATCLLAPTLCYFGLRYNSERLRILFPFLSDEPRFSFCCFGFLVWWCLRYWVLGHFILVTPDAAANRRTPILDSMTCQFSVQVKGSLRYITNHKEDQEFKSSRSMSEDYDETENGDESQDTRTVSVVHIVASAVARVWSKHLKHHPRWHRLQVPWLALDQPVVNPSKDVIVGIFAPAPPNNDPPKQAILVHEANRLSVQEIANCHRKPSNNGTGTADCAVILAANYPSTKEPPASSSASSSSSSSSVLNDVDDRPTPVITTTSDVSTWQWTAVPGGASQVVVVIGGLTLDDKPSSSPRNGSPGATPSAVLSLSVTVRGPDAVTAVKLVPELQTLLQFPELCDDR